MKPKILVLMATYNGERYLNEQIQSLYNQKNVDVFVKVADDRSTDKTIQILSYYKDKYKNFDFYVNETNKGFTYNFIDLLFSADDSYDYYAFCDQDDVWLDDKLCRAVSCISNLKNDNGVLYCSNLKVVDENLNELGMQEKKDVLKMKRYSSLVSNIATGCTCVFDKKLFIKVRKTYPEKIYLHDYWIYLIAKYCCEVFYDYEAHILYRQHSNNQIGSNKKIFNKNKIRNFLHPKHKTSDLLKKFYEYYKEDIYFKDLPEVELAAFYDTSIKNKTKLLFSNKIKRRKYNLLFKIKVLFNKF